MNGLLAGAAAAIFFAFAAPAYALGPSSEVRVLAPETYPYGAPWEPDGSASAFNSTRDEFLAVGEGHLPAGGYGLFFRRTLADGSPTGPVTPIADRQISFEDIPAVAYDAEHDEYLVAWADRLDPDDPYSHRVIFGQRLDGDGTKSGERFMVSDPSEWARQPAIGYDATRGRYLVAWSNPQSGQNVIMARTVGPGDAKGPEVTVSMEASYGAEYPAVARDDEHDTFLVTWARYRPAPPGQTHFFAQLLDGDGAHADAGPDLQIDEQGLGPSVPQPSGLAYNPVEDEFLAAFPEYGFQGAQEIALQRIGADGAKPAGTSNVVLPGAGSNPQVSYGGGRYLVTFGSFVRLGDWWGISVMRGTLRDGHADPVPGQSEAQLSECTGKAALTYGAGRWMLSWYGGGRRTGEDTALLDLQSQMASADAEPSTATACPHAPSPDPDPEPTHSAPEGPATGGDAPPGPANSDSADPDLLQPRIVSAAIRRRARRLSLIVRTSEEARLDVVIERRKIGRRSGKRCRATTRRNRGLRRCLRRISAGRLSSTVGTDERRLTLANLPAGAYSATLVAVDAAGNASAPTRLRFRSPGR